MSSLCSNQFCSGPVKPPRVSSSKRISSSRIRCQNTDQVIPLTYKEAGVDIDAGAELVRRISTMAPGIGGFGGLYFVGGDEFEVVGTDGVGTKLKLAFEMNVHDTIGIDLVAMNVNDIVTTGASPMFFVDQFSTGHLDMKIAEQAIKGIIRGCREANCTLIGGKVVENAGSYPDGILYEMSGCAFGVLKKGAEIDGSKIEVGDLLVGLPSTGVHSNGFSLVRSILSRSKLSLKDKLPGEDTVTIGQALLAPTKIYVKEVQAILSKFEVKGIAHITGGGFTDNIPRVFPSSLGALIRTGSWDIPRVFTWLKEAGNVNDDEMFRTFNMGIGMVLVVKAQDADRIVSENGPAFIIGEVVRGEGVMYEQAHVPVKAPVKVHAAVHSSAKLGIEHRVELLRRLAGEPPRSFAIGDEYCIVRVERIDDKLKLAMKLGVHDTIGIDLVAVNVNGIAATGAKPMSFVDYFSTSHLAVDVAERVISGIVEGCHQAGCPLRGGETAEMQRFHWEGEYMVNGYASGRVKREALIDGKSINPGDVLIGLPSSGVHAHGFSFIDSILQKADLSLNHQLIGADMTVGEVLLLPTRIYVQQVQDILLRSRGHVHGIVDVGEGGLTGSISRLLPAGLGAVVDAATWNVPVIFQQLEEAGGVGRDEMLCNLNMGVGMVLAVEKQAADKIVNESGPALVIGEVVQGNSVTYQQVSQ